jgi:uncharacterized protein YkwD
MTSFDRRWLLTATLGLVVAGCADRTPRRQPAFYDDLTRAGVRIDQGAAASMISQYRQNAGLGALSVDPRLTVVATDMVEAMASAEDVRASLRQPPLAQRLAAKGFVATASDENVSAGYHTLAEAFSGWRESRGHDRVMKLPGATHLGIATKYVPGSRYRVYWALVVAGGR